MLDVPLHCLQTSAAVQLNDLVKAVVLSVNRANTFFMH
jgi:hypothetical protein